MSDDQMPLPFPVRRTYQERGPLADLAAAAAPIQAQIVDLGRDYGTRGRDFWQKTLDRLRGLRQALQPFLAMQSRTSIPDLSIMHSVYLLDERIDRVGIAITAYLPACQRVTRERLEERHYLLNKLRELMKTIQDLIDAVTTAIQATDREGK